MGRFSKLFAFTLAEAVIVLVLLSIIAARIIPSVDATRPSSEKVLLKSAYSKLETAVSEIISNDELYPFDENDPNTYMVCNGTGTPEICSRGFLIDPTEDAIRKVVQNTTCARDDDNYQRPQISGEYLDLPGLICAVMNPLEGSQFGHISSTFTTADGIKWFIARNETNTFEKIYKNGNCICNERNDDEKFATVRVDVNGDLEPNVSTGVNIPDQYSFNIYYDGTVRIVATPEEHTGRDILANPLSNKRRPDLEDNRYDGGH